MDELSRTSKRQDTDWFDLPDPQGFVSQRYPVSAAMILWLSKERLPISPAFMAFTSDGWRIKWTCHLSC